MSDATQEAPGIRTGLGTSRYKEYELAAYVEVVQATFPREAWSGVLFSWLSLKGHLQGLHEFERTECHVTINADGRVEALFAVLWHGSDTMSVWLEQGYTVEKMLRNMGVPDSDMRVQLMRDFS
jgi:hypothetical protein